MKLGRACRLTDLVRLMGVEPDPDEHRYWKVDWRVVSPGDIIDDLYRVMASAAGIPEQYLRGGLDTVSGEDLEHWATLVNERRR